MNYTISKEMISTTDIIIIIASIFLLVKSSDWIIRSVSNIAKEYGLSRYFLAFVIIALGTSLPELTTALFAASIKEGGLILGDIIGGNIVDVTIVLGLMALIGRKIKIKGIMFKTFDETLFLTLGVLTLPLLFGIDGVISRVEGFLLIVSFGFYISKLINREIGMIHRKHLVKRDIYKDVLFLIIGIPLLLISAKMIVTLFTKIAHSYGISTYVIGLVVLALGTTIPELSIQIRSAMKGEKEIGFGNVVGSIIVNVSLILGIGAMINPIKVESAVFMTSALFMLVSSFVALLFLEKSHITWKEGLALLMMYLLFLISEIIIV